MKSFLNYKNSSTHKGFTLIELLVSLAIFAFMTAFLVSKYGNFNQSVLLTNLAYDVAITIRSAQTFGLNVQSTGATNCATLNTCFSYPYGVHFDTAAGLSNKFTLYTDIKNNCGVPTGSLPCAYDSAYVPSELINSYTMKPGNTVTDICVGTGPAPACTSLGSSGTLDVTFKRPNPDAFIQTTGAVTGTSNYAEVTLSASDGSIKKVILRSTGQIAVGS
jgi:prepilin-type N-terminal cleavage/methylation domain-containing protein